MESIEGNVKKVEDRTRDHNVPNVQDALAKFEAEMKKYKSEVVGRQTSTNIRTYNLRKRKTK